MRKGDDGEETGKKNGDRLQRRGSCQNQDQDTTVVQLASRKKLSKNNFWVIKKICPKNFQKKFFGTKHFWSKRIFGQKFFFGTKEIFGQKKIGKNHVYPPLKLMILAYFGPFL